MHNSTISLLIQGNRDSAAGFGPLINVGIFPPEERDRMDEDSPIRENQYYKIRHTDNYIFYTIKSSNVKSYGAQRTGRLVICVAIPRDKQLTEGNCLFTLLKAIYHTFISENMTPIENGSYMFNPNKYQSESFERILTEYSLESRQGPYHPMLITGKKGIICVSDDKTLAQLFLDSQYPEFRKFSEIEIGTACSDIANLKIDIPRKRTYSVFLNGIDTCKQLSNDEDLYSSKLSDTEYYTYKNVSFTLGKLLSSKDGLFNGSVRLDKVNERIDCCVKEEDKEFIYATEIQYKGTGLNDTVKDEIISCLRDKGIMIKYEKKDNDFNDVFLNKGELIILGEDEKKEITLSSKDVENYCFKIEKLKTGKERKIILYVEKKRPQSPLTGLNNPSSCLLPNNNPQKDKRETCFCLTLTLFPSQNSDLELYQYDVEVLQNNGGERRVKLFNVDITPIVEKNSNGKKQFSTSLFLDKSWYNSRVCINITNRKDKTQAVLEDYFVNKDDEIKIYADQFEKKKSSSSRSRRKVVIALLVGLVIGGATSGGIGFYVDKGMDKEVEEEVTQTTPDVSAINYGGDISGKEVEVKETKEPDVVGVESGDIVNAPVQQNEQNSERDRLRGLILDAVNSRAYINDVNNFENNIQIKYINNTNIVTNDERKAIDALYYGIEIGTKIIVYSKNDAAKKKLIKLLKDKQFNSIEEIVRFKPTIENKLK